MATQTKAKPADVWDREVSPFHQGEAALHARLGIVDRQDAIGRRIVRSFMIDQHREFFAQLPFMVAGSVDAEGAPWASALFGAPGFASTPDDVTMAIDTQVLAGDPFAQNAIPGAPVSYVGIELATRRRNRLNGLIRDAGAGRFVTDVVQSFGNCPQYIHTRDLAFTRDLAMPFVSGRETFRDLDATAQDIIARTDTFFVASYNPVDDQRTNGGVDVNHRSGNPGFVRIDGNTLTVPDFRGNFAFNTLGNFLVNPRAGLLFIDFASGDILQLTGTVELLWDKTAEIEAFEGAQRAWRFHLDHGQRLVGASPLAFTGGEASPRSLQTGSWQ